MKQRFLKLSVDELLVDHEFVSAVSDKRNDARWCEFLHSNKEFGPKFYEAKKILTSINADDGLTREEIGKLWESIRLYNLNHAKTIAIRKKSGMIFRIAASFLILISLGVLISFYIESTRYGKYDLLSGSLHSFSEPALIMSDSRIIQLNDNSWLSVNDKEITINKERSVPVSINKQKSRTDKMNELVVPLGRKIFIMLEDSTKIWLCAGSRLAFPSNFSAGTREVIMDGEGYFEVKHMSKKPFIVRSKEINVRVLGTTFYLSSFSQDREIRTVLFNGSVALNTNSPFNLINKKTILVPGQKAIFDKEDKLFDVSPEKNTEMYVAWTKGWFSFSRENLSDVFTKLERYYNVKINYAEPDNQNDQITGKLDLKASIEDVMSIISGLTNINYEFTEQNIINVKPN